MIETKLIQILYRPMPCYFLTSDLQQFSINLSYSIISIYSLIPIAAAPRGLE